MSKFRKKPVVIDATRWFKNGDHPEDHQPIHDGATSTDRERYDDYLQTEGRVVRYFRRPGVAGGEMCKHCRKTMHIHGWLDTPEGGSDGAQVVCPGDWIITGVAGERYPVKDSIFRRTYEPVDA